MIISDFLILLWKVSCARLPLGGCWHFPSCPSQVGFLTGELVSYHMPHKSLTYIEGPLCYVGESFQHFTSMILSNPPTPLCLKTNFANCKSSFMYLFRTRHYMSTVHQALHWGWRVWRWKMSLSARGKYEACLESPQLCNMKNRGTYSWIVSAQPSYIPIDQ